MDLSTKNVQRLFQKQITDLTKRTVHREDSFDYQFSGAWLG